MRASDCVSGTGLSREKTAELRDRGAAWGPDRLDSGSQGTTEFDGATGTIPRRNGHSGGHEFGPLSTTDSSSIDIPPPSSYDETRPIYRAAAAAQRPRRRVHSQL